MRAGATYGFLVGFLICYAFCYVPVAEYQQQGIYGNSYVKALRAWHQLNFELSTEVSNIEYTLEQLKVPLSLSRRSETIEWVHALGKKTLIGLGSLAGLPLVKNMITTQAIHYLAG